jgi:hypothetical protein
VLKFVADKGNSLEDRLAFLQARFSQQVTDQVRGPSRSRAAPLRRPAGPAAPGLLPGPRAPQPLPAAGLS